MTAGVRATIIADRDFVFSRCRLFFDATISHCDKSIRRPTRGTPSTEHLTAEMRVICERIVRSLINRGEDMSLSHFAGRTLSAGLLVLSAAIAFGQEYPNKPIRIVTGTPGGGNDIIARQIGQGISGPLGQQVI